MLEILKSIKVGSLIKVEGIPDFCEITEINECRNNFKIKGYMGSFQWGHVENVKEVILRLNDKGEKALISFLKENDKNFNNFDYDVKAAIADVNFKIFETQRPDYESGGLNARFYQN